MVDAVGGKDHVAVEHQPPDPLLADLFRPVGRKADEVAVALDDRGRNALGRREARLLAHVAHLAMDRDQYLRPDPAVHGRQLGPARDGPRHGYAPAAR